MKRIFVVWMAFLVVGLHAKVAYCADEKPVQKNGAKPLPKKSAKPLSKKAAEIELRYQEALQLHRQNKPEAALSILDELRRANPGAPRFLHDYLAIASAAGKHDLVLEVAAKELDQKTAPPYVLEAVASSQRQKQMFDSALATYDLVIKRFPGRVEAQAGRVVTLIDAQRYKEAETELAPLQGKYPARADILECVIRLSDALNQPMKTLSAAEEFLKKEPENHFALRMRFYALKKLGAAHLALQVTPKSILTETEQIAAKRDQFAFDLRWARSNLDKQEPASRWKEMDAVISNMWEVCRQAESGKDESGDKSIIVRGGCGDLVEALSDRRQMKEAIALYEKMLAKRWPVTPYVQVAAGNAYYVERQPEKARDLFADVLAQEPNNFSARQGYVYALLECGQYDLLDRELEKLTANTNEWINPKLLGFREPNPDYLQAQKTNALVRSYTNRLPEGENLMQTLAQRSPNSADVTRALDTVYHLRGWPHRAEGDLEALRSSNPPDAWTALGLFENRMAIGDFRGADQQLKTAVQLRPEERVIQGAQRQWETHNLAELNVESRFGQSSGGNAVAPNGSHEYYLDATLYSRPMSYDWRIFAHAQLARSLFPGLGVTRNAAGMGGEYRIRDYSAKAEVRSAGHDGTGVSLDQTYHFNDYWSVNGLLESKSLSTPIRAYPDGVSANNIHLAAIYRASESRSANLQVNQMNFSDRNRREAVDASWTERLKASPTYLLDATIEYYSSNNSLQNALINYFNPARDHYYGLSFRNEWLHFQRYERSLKHVLTVGIGRYAQQNFASGDVVNIRYEQIYRPSGRLELRYGINRTEHPYDGVRVVENSAEFAADWMF